MRRLSRWFIENVLGTLRLIRALRRISRMVDRGEQPPGRRVLVWRQGSTRIDTYDSEGQRVHSMTYVDHWGREHVERLAAELGWGFEAE